MNVLLIGSGGRGTRPRLGHFRKPPPRHALLRTRQSGHGEGGTNAALDVTDHAAVIRFCGEKKIGFVVVGPKRRLSPA